MWFLFPSCFSALRPKSNHFRIHKKCYFPVKFLVSLIIFVRDCSSNFSPFSFRIFTFSESYKKHDPEYRREVAKHTAIYGIRPTAKKYCISESTVRGFIKSFKRQQEEQPNANFFAFPKIKKWVALSFHQRRLIKRQ